MGALARAGIFSRCSHLTKAEEVFGGPSLNAFMAAGKKAWIEVRTLLIELLIEGGSSRLRNDAGMFVFACISDHSYDE
jgi:hypothetical protein